MSLFLLHKEWKHSVVLQYINQQLSSRMFLTKQHISDYTFWKIPRLAVPQETIPWSNLDYSNLSYSSVRVVFTHSFIFSKHFILVWVVVEAKTIPRTLSMNQENTLAIVVQYIWNNSRCNMFLGTEEESEDLFEVWRFYHSDKHFYKAFVP